ncbi:MAG: hypothetical protein V8S33_04970 [Intestinibacter bartlettii]
MGRKWQQEGLQIGGKNEDIYLGNNICMETHKFNQGLPSYKKGYWKYHVVTNKGDFSNSTTNAS